MGPWRGNRINIDLGLGKVVRPGDFDEDGFVPLLDTWSRWHGFALDETTLTWSLFDVGEDEDRYRESGTIDLAGLDREWTAMAEVAARWQGKDLRVLAKQRGSGMRCSGL